jgi:hypothetical protein
MGNINLAWNNSDVTAAAGVTAVRLSKRIKAIGGVWDTSGFTPSNDIDKTLAAAVSAVTNNRVYEYKLESVCSGGDLVPNLNGVIEQIFFACVNPSIAKTHNSAYVTVALGSTDITKIRVTLKKESDDTTVQTITTFKIGSNAIAHFSSLTPSTAYYVQIELFANVGGVEVVSSGTGYIEAVCGGTAAFDFTTEASSSPVTIVGGVGATILQACSGDATYYIASPATDISDGVPAYADSGLTIPLTGYSYIRAKNGKIFTIDTATGIVGPDSAANCGGDFLINNTMAAGNSITSVSPGVNYYISIGGGFPVVSGTTRNGGHGTFSDAISVAVTLVAAGTLHLYKNGALLQSVAAAITGTYAFTGVSFIAADDIEIRLVSTT